MNRRDQLLAEIQHLAVTCPHGDCNPCICPLHGVRKLDTEERIAWVRSLSNGDLEYLTTYHQICLQWMNCNPKPTGK